ncbi:hypothetical protein ACWD0J_02545 [Streptomyces sp. NPDC003011]
MAVMTEALLPALEDVRDAHRAVADRLRADVAVTPPGRDRQTMEIHLTDVQDTLRRIEQHIRDLRPRDLLDDTVDIARFLARGAVRVTRLPLTIGTMMVTGLLRGGRPPDERELLKNAEEEYAVIARALAACRAGQGIAEHVPDLATAALLASLRRQDEELLETLEDTVARQARAVAARASGRRPPQGTGDGLTETAAQTVRAALGRVWEAARSGSRPAGRDAEDTVRGLPDATVRRPTTDARRSPPPPTKREYPGDSVSR